MGSCIYTRPVLNTLSPRQSGHHFPDSIFRCIFLNENVWISTEISLTFICRCPINNIPALVQIIALHLSGNKSLSEPIMVSLLTHIYVTLSQWIKELVLIELWDFMQETTQSTHWHWFKFGEAGTGYKTNRAGWKMYIYHAVVHTTFLGIYSAMLLSWPIFTKIHYSDGIMSMIASQITSVLIVYSIVCSGENQRKYQSSASLAFVRGIHRWPVNSPHKGPVMWKMFPFDDVTLWWDTHTFVSKLDQH